MAIAAINPTTTTPLTIDKIAAYLGADADKLLNYTSKTVSKDQLHLPGPNFVSEVWADSDRTPRTLRSLQQMFDHGRLGGTGYLSILPVDQGVEHSAAASFSKNPAYFDPLNLLELALAGESNAVATTLSSLGLSSRQYEHRIPYIVTLNTNSIL